MEHKILVVEDNEDIRENAAELLELFNYEVWKASNGQEALEMALQQPPDLILCDIIMPVMDGYELLKSIRKQPSLSNSRFIFFTASCEKKEVELGMRLGADDYIMKPFSGDDLLDKIRTLLMPALLLIFIQLALA